MTDKETMEADPVALRKDRARHQANVRKLKNRIQSMLDEDDLASVDLYQLDDWASSMDTSLRRCNKSHDTLIQEETDEALMEEDETAWDLFYTSVIQTRSLCKRLATMRTVTVKIQALDMSISSLEHRMARDPRKEYKPILEQLTGESNGIATLLQSSTIPADHFLWSRSREVDSKLLDIGLKYVVPSITDSKDFCRGGDKDSTYKLPKINLPKFQGGLENWHSYWGRFKTAVHDNDKLDNEAKMAHLLETVTDPVLSST